ncbi:MAG: helix-turn-helix transcriptional regulator [Bacillota bacterium]|nr:helix-turn-helix transcriptional regulator [Bacillota bacterium]
MNYDFEKSLGHNIRRIREEQGLTQEQLSARLQTMGCDITRSALAKIEVGQRHIYPDELKCFTHSLQISYDELFMESQPRNGTKLY